MLKTIAISPPSSRSNFNFKEEWANIPDLNENYTTQTSKAKTITALGSSKSTPQIQHDINRTESVIREIILDNKNINHGCGKNGMMGAFYRAAHDFSTKDFATGKPQQNLAIVMNPPYGDEDIKHCTTIGTATSEHERIGKFQQTSNHFLVEKGSVTTLQEATSVIGENKNVILIGKEFFAGLTKQYHQLFKSGFLPLCPEEMFACLENADIKEILDKINNPSTISKFAQAEEPSIRELSNCSIVYNGGKETLKKAITLIQKNDYLHLGEVVKPLYFVGDFFNGLKQQYQAIFDAGLLKHKPSELFRFIGTNEAKKFGRLM